MKSASRISPDIATSALTQSAGKRALISLTLLAMLWIAIAWAVAIP